MYISDKTRRLLSIENLLLRAGISNNETVATFTQESVHLIFSLHIWLNMNGRRGLVWPTNRSTCFVEK